VSSFVAGPAVRLLSDRDAYGDSPTHMGLAPRKLQLAVRAKRGEEGGKKGEERRRRKRGKKEEERKKRGIGGRGRAGHARIASQVTPPHRFARTLR